MMFIGVTLVSYLLMPYPCSGMWYSLSAAMRFSTSCKRSSWSWSSTRMALMVIFCVVENPAVGDVALAHSSVTVRMDGTEVGIDRIRLFL